MVELLKLLRKIAADLNMVKQAITGIANNNRASEHQRIPSPKVIAEVHLPKPGDYQPTSYEKGAQARDKIRLGIEAIGVIALAIAIPLTIKQYKETAKATRETARANLLTLHSVYVDNRAWLIITPSADPKQEPRVGVPVRAKIEVSNVGKTPARAINLHASMEIVKNGNDPSFSYAGSVQLLRGLIVAGDKYTIDLQTIDRDFKSGDGIVHRLTQSEVDDFRAAKTFLVVYSKAEYVDIFGVLHRSQACSWIAFPKEGPSPVPSKTKFTAFACTDYNTVDNNLPTSLPPLGEK